MRPRLSHPLTSNRLTLLVALLCATAFNTAFWRAVSASLQPLGVRQWLFMGAVFVILVAITGLLLNFLAWRRIQKPLFAVAIALAATAAYFMNSYGAVVDKHALQSVLETDAREGMEWVTWGMLWPLLVSVVGAICIRKLPVQYQSWPKELRSRLLLAAGCLLAIGMAVAPFYQDAASLARNHPELRHLANPFNLFNATRAYIKTVSNTTPVIVSPLGGDAHGGSRYANDQKPRLLVLVIGESARASSFQLGGYERETNPELSRTPLTYFSRVSSCGTNTATSVPCMFSNLGRARYQEKIAKSSENLLDVISHDGFAVEWEDNNTGSKGVANRVKEEMLANLNMPIHCTETNCFDEMLLEHLRTELLTTSGDKVFVLHQLGSHGPAYYQRYPAAFEKFTPVCRTNALQQCTPEQIHNTYDNTILYTDHVLARLITLLQRDTSRNSAMLYISDHGESTGEHGLYLHGTPYLVAPSEQTHIPMLLWMSQGFVTWRGINTDCLAKQASNRLSHDNFFHSVLGLLNIQTTAYESNKDIFAPCATT